MRLFLPALLGALLASPASTAFLVHYQTLPGEHDDQGRSDEPDRAFTAVLGPRLDNCVLSFSPLSLPGLGRACVPDPQLPPPQGAARVLAPGCSDDSGRRPSGLCALHSNGLHGGDNYLLQPGVVGVQGMTGNRAPGAYTPTKASVVRFLDLQMGLTAPAASYIETNRKLADAGLAGALSQLDPSLGSPVVPAVAALWAWYGVWQDKNGNGVVDHLGDSEGQAFATNEFRWAGGCTSSAGVLSAELCLRETGLVFPLWVYPGSHHQLCGFQPGCYVPADLPGRQAVCLAATAADPAAFRCPEGDPDDEQRVADPLLGPLPARVSADGELVDLTGEPRIERRLWHYGPAPAYFYDQSLLVTTLVVGGPTLKGKDPGLATHYDLAALQFVDVDRYQAWLPLLGDLLHGTARPPLRGAWVLARDNYRPLATWADGQANQRALDAPSQQLAEPDDRLRDPGWSREPNTALDSFPAARFDVFAPSGELPASEQRHRGWLNDDAGYQSGWHAWADLKARRIAYTYGKWTLDGSQSTCLQPCGIGGGYHDSFNVLPGEGGAFPRPAGEHGRSLEPGLYAFQGFVGAWRDQGHAMLERVLDPGATLEEGFPVVQEERYVLPPDGWVGNLVNTTGTWRYRGYGQEPCTIAGQPASRPWAHCHPYVNGDVAEASVEAGPDQSFGVDLTDPQDPLDPREFQVLTTPPPSTARVVLRPEGGTWKVPVFVWRDFYHWRVGDVAAFEDFTGKSQPIELATLPELAASLRSRVATQDFVVLPLGNLGLGVTTEFAFRVQVSVPSRGIAVDELVVDADTYRAWGAG